MDRQRASAMVVAAFVLVVPLRSWADGDVTATVADGRLKLTGDDGFNALQILPAPGDRSFAVVGVDATTVNGQPTFTASSVQKIVVDLGVGDDRVEVTGADVSGNLIVKLGKGNDSLILDGARVQGKLEVEGGKGGDTITLRMGTRVAQFLNLTSGSGNDTLRIADSSVGEDASISLGAGNDTITLEGATFDGPAPVEIGGSDGNDVVQLLGANFENDVTVRLAAGDDDVAIRSCDFDEEAVFKGGEDDDEILFDENSFNLGSGPSLSGFEDVDL
jgi:hypothetical protein